MAIVLQAPGPDILFGTAPSGATYISDANGLVVISGQSNIAVEDELYLMGAGCVGLVPGGFGNDSNQTGTVYTVQLTDLAQEIVCTNTGAFTLWLGNNFPVGFYVNATQGGAGTVTAQAFGGASTVGAHQTTQGQYLQLKCVVVAAGVWATMRVGG